MPWPQVSSREATARGAAAGPEGVAEAVVAVTAVSATAEAINTINSSGLHSPSRSISSSTILSSSGRQDSTLAGGNHRVFVSVAASPDTSMQSVKRYLPRR